MMFNPDLALSPCEAPADAQIVQFPMIPMLHNHPDYFRQRHAEQATLFARRLTPPVRSRPVLISSEELR